MFQVISCVANNSAYKGPEVDPLHLSGLQSASLSQIVGIDPEDDKMLDSKTLTNLPNEILTRILKYVIEEENVTFQVFCGGDEVDELLIGEEYAPSWTPAWAPGLRLVTTTLEAISSPLLADQTTLRVVRGPSFPDEGGSWIATTPIQLAQLFPQNLTACAKRIAIIDKPAIEFMYPMVKLDLTGFPKLESVVFATCDLQLTEQNTILVVKKLMDLKQRLDGLKPESAARSTTFLALTRWYYHVLTVRVLDGVIVDSLSEDFWRSAGEDDYKATVWSMIDDVWALARENMIGLKASTSLIVELHMGEEDRFVSRAFCARRTAIMLTTSIGRCSVHSRVSK